MYISTNHNVVCTCGCTLYKSTVLKLGLRSLRLCMRPLLIVGRVMCGMRPASGASEAIEAEVLLMVWDVLHPKAVGKGG